MPASYTALWYHLVFATKQRQPLLTAAIRQRVHEYMAGIVELQGGTPRAIGGIEDHVHLLLSVRQDQTIADIARLIKANSSKWVNQQWPKLAFSWQTGYSAFTVSVSQKVRVQRYIENQQEHHRSQDYGEELREMLRRHVVPFSEDHLIA
ncbi:MAG: IS200/IS605 family transposase [Planctomycetes bacterium]|nr:IS200/IS605 family transposase [Planctomycetota bacterium]